MKVWISFFLMILIALTLPVAAQQQLNIDKSAVWNGDTPPDIQQTNRIISEWYAQGKSPAEISQQLNDLIQNSEPGSAAISGQVWQSDGITALPVDFQITVYDLYGIYEASVYTSAGKSFYTVSNLSPGLHYVKTNVYSNDYLDEFYDGTYNWQQATLVQTINDSTISGINFQLEKGKVISGKVLEENSLDPLAQRYANFTLYEENAMLDQDYSMSYGITIAEDGTYHLNGIHTGNYKLKIIMDEFAPEFYNNKADLEMAHIIQVPEIADTVAFINFLLGPVVGLPDGYEPNATLENAYEFAIGAKLTPQINPAGDLDFFTFTANKGDSVDIILEAQSIQSQLYPYLSLYDSSGSNLSNWSNGDIYINNYIFLKSGRYFLRVSNGSGPQGGDNFFYELSVSYSKPVMQTSAHISGHVYQGDETTPYNSGYYITLYDNDGNYLKEYLFKGSEYVISEIPAGTFKLYLNSGSSDYLSEYYEDAITFNEATPISVADEDSVTDINFVLDRSGGISGRIFLDNLLNDYTGSGWVYLIDPENPNNQYSFYINTDEQGLFVVSGIRAGEFTLRFDPSLTDYPSVWYENVGTQRQATPVTISPGDTTGNIALILKRGGLIQGFINQEAMNPLPLSGDSLEIVIVQYDDAGFVTNYTFNTFNGGYRTSFIYPGSYKLQVLSSNSILASWYYDNGSHFDDPGSQTVEVMSDSVHELNVTMSVETGSISGVVYDGPDFMTATDQQGIVFAYDITGHMAQSVTIRRDPQTGQLLDNGHYRISGLKAGTYYVMLTLNSGNQIRERIKIGELKKWNKGQDILADRIGGYFQKWYPDVEVEMPYFDQLFFQPIPDGAMTVEVSTSTETGGINFNARPNSVANDDKKELPDKFELSSVYPNPFNPATTISYKVPSRSRVTIDIFDILGRKVITLLDEIKSPGLNRIKWDGKNHFGEAVSTGLYIARLKAGGTQSSKKMILMR